MSTSRQSQDMLLYLKNKNFKYVWNLIKNFDKTTYDDTFMPIICNLKGHKAYQPDEKNDPNEYACKRCHRYITYNPRKEKLKKLNKLK